MLIEKYLPTFDVRDYHELAVQGEPERAYAALRSVDFNRSRLVRALFAVRTLPSRLLLSWCKAGTPTRILPGDSRRTGLGHI